MFSFQKFPSSFQEKRKLPSCQPRNTSYDADQLLLQLSIYGFSKLSVSDQCLHTEEIQKRVVENIALEQLSEESQEGFRMRTFTELLKKLPSTYKYLFVNKVIKKFKHERQFGELISTFKKLDARDQQKELEIIVHVAPEMVLQIAGETDEEFRLRRFTQLSKDYTDHVYECLHKKKKFNSGNDYFLEKLQNSFSDFVSDFSTIWFQGQTADVQKEMIQLLIGDGMKDGIIKKRYRAETVNDFQLTSFRNLYSEEMVDFHAQLHFIDTAEGRLFRQERRLPHKRLILPQDSDSAAQLLFSLSTFGFSLLFEKDQQDKIDEISKEVGLGRVNNQRQRATEESDEDFRMSRLKELFSELPMGGRIECFDELTEKFFRERRFCESIVLFRCLGSHEQIELIQNLFDRIMSLHPSSQRFDVIVEKLTEKSEEDFRLSRFKKMYMAEPSSVWNWFCRPEAEKLGQEATLQLDTPENKETPEIRQSRFAEFFMGLAITWFKARCANHPRNPVHVILSGESSELFEVDDASEKLNDESEADFRLRRFIESFERLDFASKERIVKYIKRTLFHDLGYQPIDYITGWSSREPLERRGLFHPELIKSKTLHLKNPRAGGGSAIQGGRGGQGTSKRVG